MQRVNNSIKNQTEPADRPFHSWYQIVLGFPPHFVRCYLSKFGVTRDNLVLDSFCGTGTTNVECKHLGIDSLGLEANPMAQFAACTKTNWEVPVNEFERSAKGVASAALRSFRKFKLAEDSLLFQESPITTENEIVSLEKEPHLTPEQVDVLPKDFISKRPLRKVLILKELILRVPQDDVRNALLLALANVIVNDASNIRFGPEIHTAKKKRDAEIVSSFLVRTSSFARDLRSKPTSYGSTCIKLGDARCITNYFNKNREIDFVITSPPYPNEKDYTRITRLESIILGFVKDRKNLRAIKANLLRSNSRNIFFTDTDDQFVKDMPSISKLANEIECKRLSLGKTSGFEKMYHRIVRQYFGGMFRYFADMKELLAPNARLAYVVGDQMSFFRINIPTAKLLGEIAERLNYKVEGIEFWRSRMATATKRTIDENVLILKNAG